MDNPASSPHSIKLVSKVSSPLKTRWAGLNYDILQQCMHCGLCLSVCPTFAETRRERHSPRGRIALTRAIADKKIPLTREFAKEIYFCLGCLACMSACPSGVNYALIFEHVRAEVERTHILDTPTRKIIRALTIKWLFMDLNKLILLGKAIKFYQRLGMQKLLRSSGILKIMPKRLRELESMTPDIPDRFSSDLIAEITPARNGRKYRVAFLVGCAQDLIFSQINRDSVQVLSWNHCEVYTPRNQYCCGSLHAHNGETELARQLAIRQLTMFPVEDFDAIISNAGGCGSHMKHYYSLLKDHPKWSHQAKLWDSKVKDIHEWLAEIEFTPPQPPNNLSQKLPSIKVTYHESCHLAHGQKITLQPRTILNSIPGLKLIELPESNWCCGSAGIYNITQPEMANKLLQRKINHILETGASVVANGNSGCLLQLINGMKQRNLPIRVVHPITLLAEAYQRQENAKN